MKSRWLGALLSVRRKLGSEALGVSRMRAITVRQQKRISTKGSGLQTKRVPK